MPSNKHRQEVRNRKLIFHTSDISGDQLDCHRRLKFFDKRIKRFRRGIARLDFNRNDLAVFFYDEFQLGAVIRLVVMQCLNLIFKRFRHEIFVDG